jgi:RHS repeat-associated protein
MARQVNTDVLTYTWDVALGLPQVMAMSDGAQYVHGLDLVAEYRDGEWSYPLGDALGSVRQWTDESGFITYRGSYTPFGVALSSEGSTESAWGYTGEWEDASLGAVYLRARWYQPQVGRFTKQDPWRGSLWQPRSMQGYGYTQNSPVIFRDPSGLCIPGLDCPDEALSSSYPGSSNPYGINFTAAPGQSWLPHDQAAVVDAASHISLAMARLLLDRNRELMRTGDLERARYVPDPGVLFCEAFGPVEFFRSAANCMNCWAETWAPRITIYTNVPSGGYTPHNAAHELGHFFAQRAGRQPYTDLDAAQIQYVDPETNSVIPVAGGGWETGYVRTDLGYATARSPWQQNWWTDTPNEDFADMFLGWSYKHFANDEAGAVRHQWMTSSMPRWMVVAAARTPY